MDAQNIVFAAQKRPPDDQEVIVLNGWWIHQIPWTVRTPPERRGVICIRTNASPIWATSAVTACGIDSDNKARVWTCSGLRRYYLGTPCTEHIASPVPTTELEKVELMRRYINATARALELATVHDNALRGRAIATPQPGSMA